MRSVIVVMVLTFACAVGANAQQATKEHNMTGCLQKSTDAKMLMLNDAETGKKTTVKISESTANLTPHVGHKVEITGTTDTTREEKEGKGAGHFMKVTAVKMIAAKCP